jgi:hypothetical protein
VKYVNVMLRGVVTKQFKVMYTATSDHHLRLSVCLSVAMTDVNCEPTGTLGTETI